ncbi:phosphate acyltransferase PlsX [Alkalinema sp. FACHB-956]|uniref:phosphate acyltransferase PlsX n=1 Tax=Alkalinema sp. FACHB-956 TaxID=2692768 RepID=UPI001687D1F1|nr:phosphate acyltransferase PlsX [Alkalinema sp. FACHB-956]MBD2325577.1 phosphate acyltransferase PlsX [Alkalinema sp. FACHB-956]
MGSTRVRIAIDAMGGDHAPAEIVAGALKAQEAWDVDVLLVGDPQELEACLANHTYSRKPEIVPAEGVVEMSEEPGRALRRKPKASINVSMNLVKSGQADAVFSAGHSGAAMAAALLRLGRLPGIDRPAIGAVFPTMIPNKPVIVLDVGANVDCRPKYLEQFALMGTVYAQYVMGNPEPRVGLLNIGEEDSKGNEVALAANQLLRDNPHIPFIGNAEGRDVLSGQFDVVVCDGFVGNVLLKFAEAVGDILLQILKEELPRGKRGKLGTAVLRHNLRRIKQRVDHAEHGGALLLGVAGICIIGHGSSKAGTVCSAIRLAKEAVENQVLERIRSSYEETVVPAIAENS